MHYRILLGLIYDFVELISLIIFLIVMYLPSFYKVKFEKYSFNVKRFLPFSLVGIAWGIFSLYVSYLDTMA